MNLNQVTLTVSDVERAIAFYRLLGLKLIVRSLPHYARFECPNGESTFSLHLGEAGNPPSARVYFEVDDLDKTAEDLLAKGLMITEMPEDKPWLWREARLKDPDDNVIIIYHAGKNRKDPPWRIDE